MSAERRMSLVSQGTFRSLSRRISLLKTASQKEDGPIRLEVLLLSLTVNIAICAIVGSSNLRVKLESLAVPVTLNDVYNFQMIVLSINPIFLVLTATLALTIPERSPPRGEGEELVDPASEENRTVAQLTLRTVIVIFPFLVLWANSFNLFLAMRKLTGDTAFWPDVIVTTSLFIFGARLTMAMRCSLRLHAHHLRVLYLQGLWNRAAFVIMIQIAFACHSGLLAVTLPPITTNLASSSWIACAIALNESYAATFCQPIQMPASLLLSSSPPLAVEAMQCADQARE